MGSLPSSGCPALWFRCRFGMGNAWVGRSPSRMHAVWKGDAAAPPKALPVSLLGGAEGEPRRKRVSVCLCAATPTSHQHESAFQHSFVAGSMVADPAAGARADCARTCASAPSVPHSACLTCSSCCCAAFASKLRLGRRLCEVASGVFDRRGAVAAASDVATDELLGSRPWRLAASSRQTSVIGRTWAEVVGGAQ